MFRASRGTNGDRWSVLRIQSGTRCWGETYGKQVQPNGTQTDIDGILHIENVSRHAQLVFQLYRFQNYGNPVRLDKIDNLMLLMKRCQLNWKR